MDHMAYSEKATIQVQLHPNIIPIVTIASHTNMQDYCPTNDRTIDNNEQQTSPNIDVDYTHKHDTFPMTIFMQWQTSSMQ